MKVKLPLTIRRDFPLIIALLAFVMATYALLSNSHSYPRDVFAQFPESFWISGPMIFLLGGVEGLYRLKKGASLFPAYLCILLGNMLVLLVPLFGGYFLSDPIDSASQVGEVIAIMDTGHLPTGTAFWGYPLIFSFLVDVLGLRPNLISLLSLLGLYALNTLGVYLLARSLKLGKRGQFLATMMAGTLVYPEILVSVPRTFMYALFPLWLFFVFRTRGLGRVLALLMFAFSFNFTHPFDGGPLLWPVLLSISFYIAREMGGRGLSVTSYFKEILSSRNFGLVVMIWVIVWLVFVLSPVVGLYPTFQALLKSLQSPNLIYEESVLSGSHLPFSYSLAIITKIYGVDLLYWLVGAMMSVFILLRRMNFLPTSRLISLIFVFISVVGVAMLLVPINYFFYQFIPYFVVLSSLLCGVAAEGKNLLSTRRAFAVVLVLLVLADGVGVLSIYQSPWTNSVNYMPPMQEAVTVRWFLDNCPNSCVFLQSFVHVYHIASALVGFAPPLGGFTGLPPTQLNYTLELHDLGIRNIPYGYLVIPYWFYNYYQYRFPNLPAAWVYNETEAIALANNSHTLLIYSNTYFSILALITGEN